MRVYVADETALVKEVSADTGSIVQQWGEQSRPDAVTAMCFGGADEREVFLGRKNGTLSVVRDGELVDLVEGCSEQFCGLSVHEDTIVTCAQDGVVRYRSLNALEEGEEEADFHTVKAHQNVKWVHARARAAGRMLMSTPLTAFSPLRVAAHCQALVPAHTSSTTLR